jgi:hypothetical protein
MWCTSDQGGGTLRAWSTSKPKPIRPQAEIDEERRDWERAADDGTNLRTGNWAAPWKDAPLPGTPEEARARQKRTRFRYHEQRDTSLKWTDSKARSAARKGGSRRSRRKTEANRAKGRYGILGARYGKLGGRPRKPRP